MSFEGTKLSEETAPDSWEAESQHVVLKRGLSRDLHDRRAVFFIKDLLAAQKYEGKYVYGIKYICKGELFTMVDITGTITGIEKGTFFTITVDDSTAEIKCIFSAGSEQEKLETARKKLTTLREEMIKDFKMDDVGDRAALLLLERQRYEQETSNPSPDQLQHGQIIRLSGNLKISDKFDDTVIFIQSYKIIEDEPSRESDYIKYVKHIYDLYEMAKKPK